VRAPRPPLGAGSAGLDARAGRCCHRWSWARSRGRSIWPAARRSRSRTGRPSRYICVERHRHPDRGRPARRPRLRGPAPLSDDQGPAGQPGTAAPERSADCAHRGQGGGARLPADARRRPHSRPGSSSKTSSCRARARSSSFAWLGELSRPEHLALRATIGSWPRSTSIRTSPAFRLAYLVRAVTPGSFVVPGVQVEDMVAPGFHARGPARPARRPRPAEAEPLGGPAAVGGDRARGLPCARRRRDGARPALPAGAGASLAERSVLVTDRQGRLLRPFTTADGLWRLPVTLDRVLGRLSGAADRHRGQALLGPSGRRCVGPAAPPRASSSAAGGSSRAARR
jgi:hypothetical protein